MKGQFDDWEGWYFHHLARRAKTFGLESTVIKSLEKAGWSLTKTKKLPSNLIPNIINSLERLASIKNFEKTCDNPECDICKKVVKEYSKGEPPELPYRLSLELYKWQKEAKKLWWENGGRGIVKVVTGAGKTIFALSLISDLFNSEAYKEGGLRVIIVVPTTVLLDQWFAEIMDKLHIPKEEIGVFYGKEKEKVQQKKVVIYVVNSARKHLREHYLSFFKKDDLFLIADECHRYGSKENSKIFEIPYSYTLGLSATPERHSDYGFEEKLLPNLGPVIYSYTYSEAVEEGIIPPYKLIRVVITLSANEENLYGEYTEKIVKINRMLLSKYSILRKIHPNRFMKELNKIYEKEKDELIANYISLLNRRKSVIHLSKSKLYALKWLFTHENLVKDKVLVFHERIEIAEVIKNFLTEKGFKCGIYHSKLPREERLKNISEFKDGKTNILIACRALDEGFDVPAADTGIIVAGTSSVRQWIQRMGRILRKAPGKDCSKIYVIFAKLVERDVFTEEDLALFEREAIGVEEICLKD